MTGNENEAESEECMNESTLNKLVNNDIIVPNSNLDPITENSSSSPILIEIVKENNRSGLFANLNNINLLQLFRFLNQKLCF